ncbi:DUF4238 domain-containing protein [Bdellovibrio sp. SKB1291214]|uniref:hypothetical protein n=2 Tax=unclassified Bdellovibrio TaxID=2633795 RepID=UPI000B5153DD|nr:hypothetical protein [Bdellovibrio sp. SKB1291214]UYL07434.1 DUF4238 domain-containing protein [Bdellovibrio sp. SKB1291214]
MKNNHYISKFLTQRWRSPGLPLWHYDFKKKHFSDKHSVDRLFARRNLWSDQIEDFLRDNTENFSPTFLAGLEAGAQPAWDEYKALFLLILFQAARVSHAQTGHSNLSALSIFSSKKLEALALAAKQTRELIGFRLPNDLRFFFPETGIFPFPVDCGGYFEWIFALPISGTFCLGLVPQSVDLNLLRAKISYSHLAAWSVGTSKFCSKIVIHPDLYSYKNSLQELESKIVECRSFTDAQSELINQVHSLIGLGLSI